MKEKLKIGLLIDSFDLPEWAYEMIGNIENSDFSKVTLIVKKKNQPKSFIEKFQANYRYILYFLYRKFENRLVKVNRNAFLKKNISKLTKNIPLIEVVVAEKKFSDYFHANDIAEINKHEIDVFIRLGFRILRGEILKSAKFGIWSYHHGDNLINKGGPAGVWEVLQKWGETGSILQILTEDLDGGKVIYRSWSSTEKFINQNVNSYYWKTLSFIPRKLKELYELGEMPFMKNVEDTNSQLTFYSNKLFKTPTNTEFFILISKFLFRRIKRIVWRLFNFEQWILLYSFSNNSISHSIFRFKRLTPPKDRFWADPFVLYYNNKHYVFLEEFIYKNKIGHISVMEIENNSIPSLPRTILKKTYHLSYPFVFQEGGDFYMIPETSKNYTIELYKSTNFPYEWKFEMNIMSNIVAVDTTIHFHNGKFWLFTNIRENKGATNLDELFLFYSDSLMSDKWIEHPKSPIVSDVRKARSAGKLFSSNGKLYRPAQDCGRLYGYRTVFNEIVVLNENEYLEKVVTYIEPKWDKDVIGTHTFAYEKGLTVIDALIKKRKSIAGLFLKH